ncbi:MULTISPECIES: hypothetical protein [Streptomyces]|uniref:hypothetical protein n=1 Tax=Streptomyces TaxID=1883 RepID=UPI00055FDAEB|nr:MULTISPECIES: hypothetical protein [Streptomyces]MBZ6108274.1 hypothetical protein [Streptomyces olivaceus]MBZ6122158.1 hypothetical protein [Streptomyces olivaceus]MBZ6142979.1 hypothetical protein [Streptomyces olivaceus]MBZ6156819.1 hypothetical protein [Streptomyces olivaceus]MBZ6184615.1 hypothetical protein [Streptomyces olivaceus]
MPWRQVTLPLSARTEDGILSADIPPAELVFLLMAMAAWWAAAPQVSRMISGAAPSEDAKARSRQRASVVTAARATGPRAAASWVGLPLPRRRATAVTAPDQCEAWRSADARHQQLLDFLWGGSGQKCGFYFAGLVDLPAYVGYRLPEQSVHPWDVETVLDAKAVIPTAEAEVLWQRLDPFATRFRDPLSLGHLPPAQLALDLIDPSGAVLLDHAELHLYPYPCEPATCGHRGVGGGTTLAVLRKDYRWSWRRSVPTSRSKRLRWRPPTRAPRRGGPTPDDSAADFRTLGGV